MKKIKEISDVLDNVIKKLPISSGKVDNVKTLWSTWTWLQKFKWLWYHKIGAGKSEMVLYQESFDYLRWQLIKIFGY